MKNKSSSNPVINLCELQKQLGETKLKIALLQAALLEDERTQRHSSQSSDDPAESSHASPNEDTLRAIRSETRRLRKSNSPSILPKIMNVVAAVLLLSFISFGTAMAVSSDVRVLVMKLLYKVTPHYTEIHLVPAEEASLDIPSAWSGTYYPSYIPADYQFHSIQGSSPILDAVYVSGENKLLRFSENEGTVVGNIDTEGYAIKEIQLYGTKALLADKEGKSKVIWHQDGKILTITIDDTAEIALDVAKGVKRVR